MGHARTYLGFDIIRRILETHFGYNVTLVMNITDLDDKIIQRANERNMPCKELSEKYELEFHQDMEMLGINPPDVLTRVTEYMDEIITYINTIIEKGFAYASNGSVYFNVGGFESSSGNDYCKLEPEQINNAKLLAEGEGKLTQEFAGDKRSPRDFALWKKSKEGEPQWSSPWGSGRPGWHIECSVMASTIFSQMEGADSAEDTSKNPDMCCMDIHSGGVDLKFPHHDNELAQSEAHSGTSQWVNYFVHSGHLNIRGLKMSKSLKNFITIRQALEESSARQIRMSFLLGKYNEEMNFSDDTLNSAKDVEKIFANFFDNVKIQLRDGKITDSQRWDSNARDLQLAVEKAKINVDLALKNDFETPTVIKVLQALVKSTNVYLENCKQQKPVSLVIRNAARYVTYVFKMLGLIPETSGVDIGFPFGNAGSDGSETLAPVLDALIQFRSSVREQARGEKAYGVLKQCDAFRDDALPPLGIRLEDKADGTSVWKLADATELMKEREQAEIAKAELEEKKKKRLEEQAKKDALNALKPEDFMKQLTLEDSDEKKYSKFNDEGIPTHLHDGKEMNKNQNKKASKEFQAQKKKHDKYLQKQGS
jgi:cysteinyl-tRNA synthetase